MEKNRYQTNFDWVMEVLEIAAERAEGESKNDFLTFKSILINGSKGCGCLTPSSQMSLLPDKKMIGNLNVKRDGKGS